MQPHNTPRRNLDDAGSIKHRLDNLNLQPKPKVVSAVSAIEYEREQELIRKESGRSLSTACDCSSSSNSRERSSSLGGDIVISMNGEDGGEDETLHLKVDGAGMWEMILQGYQTVCANRIGVCLLVIVPILLTLFIHYFPNEFGHLSWEAFVTVELTISAMMLMINDQPSDLVLIGVNVVLLNTRIISLEEALKGLTSASILSIGILFIIARAMEETGVVEKLLITMLGNPTNVRMAVLRLGFPVAILSAFMNNTPIVAMMIPTVQLWSQRTGISASKLLMPLSFSAMLGGMCTLLGTSTNLILQDLAAQGVDPTPENDDDDDELTYQINMFSMTAVGVPLMFAGVIFMSVFSFLLPSRESQRWIPNGSIEVFIKTASGKTVNLVDVMAGDIISVETLENLTKEDTPQHDSFSKKSIKGQRLKLFPSTPESLDEESLEGDNSKENNSLSDTYPLWASSRDIQPVNDSDEGKREKPFYKMVIAGTLLVTMVSLAAVSSLHMSLFTLALTASCLLVLTKCITVKQAFEAVKGRVLLVIFATYGLGAALTNSGIAFLFARGLIRVGDFIGPIGLLTMIFLAVAGLSCIISNQATVILLWPVVSIIDIPGLHIGQYAVILMMAASTSFATPIGYQTNLMVYEPGGYDFKDFARMGIPLTLLLAPIAGVMTYYVM